MYDLKTIFGKNSVESQLYDEISAKIKEPFHLWLF